MLSHQIYIIWLQMNMFAVCLTSSDKYQIVHAYSLLEQPERYTGVVVVVW